MIGLLALGIGYGLPLLPLMAFFLATLAAPLLLLTVLHPQVTVYPDGLWLKPLVWRGTWVPWAAIASIEDHTLIRAGSKATAIQSTSARSSSRTARRRRCMRSWG